jgi:hypothetical protein
LSGLLIDNASRFSCLRKSGDEPVNSRNALNPTDPPDILVSSPQFMTSDCGSARLGSTQILLAPIIDETKSV